MINTIKHENNDSAQLKDKCVRKFIGAGVLLKILDLDKPALYEYFCSKQPNPEKALIRIALLFGKALGIHKEEM